MITENDIKVESPWDMSNSIYWACEGGGEYKLSQAIRRLGLEIISQLITDGRLRMVENKPLVVCANGVDHFCAICGWTNAPSYYPHCPGCGNMIKRP